MANTIVCAANVKSAKIGWTKSSVNYSYSFSLTAGVTGYNRYFTNSLSIYYHGTSPIGSYTVTQGAYPLSVFEVPSGYSFAGWYTTAKGLTGDPSDSQFTVLVSTSTTLSVEDQSNLGYSGTISWVLAKFTSAIPSCTITFNANGGSVSTTSKTVTYGSAYGTLPQPTWSGHEFIGWFTTAGGGIQITAQTIVSTAQNHTLYAHWQDVVYECSVTFDANGGSVSPTSKTVTYGSAYGALPTPTWAGHEFIGWFTAASGGTEVTSTVTVKSKIDHTIYAHWREIATCNLTLCLDESVSRVYYQINGATTWSSIDKTTTLTVNEGSTWKAYGVAAYGYQEDEYDELFGNNYLGTVSNPGVGVALTNETRYFSTKPKIFSIKFDPNGGNALVDNCRFARGSGRFGYGENINVYPNYIDDFPVRTYSGLEFTDGWIIASGDNSSGDSVLWRIFATKRFRGIELGCNYTTILEVAEITGDGCYFRFGTTTTGNSSTSQLDKTSGQYISSAGKYTFPRTAIAERDNVQSMSYDALYWAAGKKGSIKFRIMLVGGRPEGVAEWNYVNPGKVVENIPPSLPIPAREGYKFDGWYTSESGGASITETSLVATAGNRTLYAHWVPKYAQGVVFDLMGGINPNPARPYKMITDGELFGQLPTCSWSNTEYIFDGWYTEEVGGIKISPTTVYLESMGDRIYAHWKRNSVKIIFDADGGYIYPEPDDYTIGTPYGSLPSAIRGVDEDFYGWYAGRNGSGDRITESSIVPSSTITLYASYRDRFGGEFTIRFVDPTGICEPKVREFFSSETLTIPMLVDIFGEMPHNGYKVDPVKSWRDYEGNLYAGGEMVTDFAVENEMVILYAIYEPLDYEISLDANGGNFDPDAIVIYHKKYGEFFGTFPEPKRSGMKFSGWYTRALGGTQVFANTKVTGELTLFARWQNANEFNWWGVRIY